MASHDSASEEDLEISRILDERHSKNTTKSTKTALKAFVKAAGNVAELQDKEVLDKSSIQNRALVYLLTSNPV
jgi:hypothetical protein